MPDLSVSMIDVVVDEEIDARFIPPTGIQAAIGRVCFVAGVTGEPSLCIRFAPDEAVRQLNSHWRGRDCVTDVLSFPMQEVDALDLVRSLGDIALALPFIQHEAERLQLPEADHTLHLIVHATLHLLGYDHIVDAEAEQMQQLERQIMLQLGLHDPYPELQEAVN